MEVDERDKSKSWERPWSPDEIRSSASKWTLAGDSGVSKPYPFGLFIFGGESRRTRALCCVPDVTSALHI